MKVVEVPGCHECPFADASSDMAYVCQLHLPPRLAYAFSDIQQPDRPVWCPLAKTGEVVVRLVK